MIPHLSDSSPTTEKNRIEEKIGVKSKGRVAQTLNFGSESSLLRQGLQWR